MDMQFDADRLPFQVDTTKLGEVIEVNEVGPGVYYLCTRREEHPLCKEFYAVTPEATPGIVSQEVLYYGRAIEGAYLFEFEAEGSGWPLVDYELQRYKVKHGIPLSKQESIYCTALYAAENYPVYFGGMIPPRCTPYGWTVRVKKIAEGVYWLETEQCQWLLAVAYPIWSCDLSDLTVRMGEFSQKALSMGAEEYQYLFFRRERCAPALYELLDWEEYRNILAYLHSKEALETQLYKQNCGYVLWHNTLQLSGCGRSDCLDNLLAAFGCPPADTGEDEEAVMARRTAACIHYTPELAGQEFLLLP